MKRAVLLVLGVAFAIPAIAQDLRPLCPTRPGLGTPPCIVDKSHTLTEVGVGDWTRDRDGDMQSDRVIVGDMLLRYGIDTQSEVEIGWTAYGHQRDRAGTSVNRSSGAGDVSLAYKRGVANPDGSGLSAAVQPFVTLPAGGAAIGAGDWGAGVILPISTDIAEGVSLQLSPEIDAAVDEDRSGRHLAYGSVAGIGVDLSKAVNAALELSAFRDDDPSGHSTELLAAAALAWQPVDAWQLDVGSALGLNHSSPDARLYFGVARRF